MTLLPSKLAERFSQVYLSWRELKIINTLHWMQIAPTALISFSISTNVTALQACYGFTMGWVINFCELHIRHLIMPFINKCHPRYLLGEVNKLNVQLSALCKSILTPHCIFSLVCLSTRMTAEITMANKGIWGTIICAEKRCCLSGSPALMAAAWLRLSCLCGPQVTLLLRTRGLPQEGSWSTHKFSTLKELDNTYR